ncbi:MAG: 4-hydroxythreonine-4-phosphate dehydrogenase PdxA [Bacteroidota bacterium]
MNRADKLTVGITLGDVNGIGPEVAIRGLADNRFRDMFIPIVYGSSKVLNIYRKVLDVGKFHYVSIQTPTQAHHNKINLIECHEGLERVEIGHATKEGGKAAQQSLLRAVEDAQHQLLHGLITMPVDKATFQETDPDFIGHTELLAKAFNVEENLMLMASDTLRVGLVTNHVPVGQIAQNISKEQIIRKAKLLYECLKVDFGIDRPKIAIMGLNPHAGDKGLIGEEDQTIIQPAITELRNKGILAVGPFPADGYFGAGTYRKFDGTLAMYHDQGLIPFKMLSSYSGVNFTAGMPFVRTSPDHGVAYDIAGKGVAELGSFRQSVYLIMDVYRNRSMHSELTANVLKSHPLPRRKKGKGEVEDIEE